MEISDSKQGQTKCIFLTNLTSKNKSIVGATEFALSRV